MNPAPRCGRLTVSMAWCWHAREDGGKGKRAEMLLSLRVRLGLCWLVTVVMCTALGVIMHRVDALGVDAHTARSATYFRTSARPSSANTPCP